MSGGDFLAEGRSTLDFVVQTGVLLGFISAFAGFLYRFVKGQLHKTIAEKIKPVEEKVDEALTKLDHIQVETAKELAKKEEIDRERFNSVKQSQEFIKEKIHESVENTQETKKKLDGHLVEAATFIGKTETKISSLENALNNFRQFMRHNEGSNRNTARENNNNNNNI